MTMTASEAVNAKHCDIAHLLQSLAGNRSVAQNLAQMFLRMYPEKLELLDAALERADWVALRRVVHDLRGSCAMFSAEACLTLASKLEDALPNRVTSEVPEACAQLKNELANVVSELRLFLE